MSCDSDCWVVHNSKLLTPTMGSHQLLDRSLEIESQHLELSEGNGRCNSLQWWHKTGSRKEGLRSRSSEELVSNSTFQRTQHIQAMDMDSRMCRRRHRQLDSGRHCSACHTCCKPRYPDNRALPWRSSGCKALCSLEKRLGTLVNTLLAFCFRKTRASGLLLCL